MRMRILVIACAVLLADFFTPSYRAFGLPLVELPAEKPGDTLVIFISGDGGWRQLDSDVSAILTKEGFHVIGLNSMRYFWLEKTPEETTSDIARIIEHYSVSLGRKRVLLLGYSFGADVIPFVINRLPDKDRRMISGAVMMSMSKTAGFVVKYGRLFGKKETGGYQIMPELDRIHGIDMLFVGGADDRTTITHSLDRGKFRVIILPGGHHFDRNYRNLAGLILQWYDKVTRRGEGG